MDGESNRFDVSVEGRVQAEWWWWQVDHQLESHISSILVPDTQALRTSLIHKKYLGPTGLGLTLSKVWKGSFYLTFIMCM